MALGQTRNRKMKSTFLFSLVSARVAEDYPSHHFCALYGYEPVPYEKIVPDLNLKNAWPRVSNEDYVEKGQVINVQGLDMYVVGNGVWVTKLRLRIKHLAVNQNNDPVKDQRL